MIIGAALVTHTGRMLLGTAPEGPGAATAPQVLPGTTAIALVIGLLGGAALGPTAGRFTILLEHAAATLGGTP